MERLDQGHLLPKLEVPGLRLTCPRWKRAFEHLVNGYSGHLHMSPRHYLHFYAYDLGTALKLKPALYN
jgi:hypothetical protein